MYIYLCICVYESCRMPYLYKARRMPHLHKSPPDYLEAEATL